jgi:phosphocarrier protein HPr
MQKAVVTIKLERGLHATPAAMMAQTAMKFKSAIRFIAESPSNPKVSRSMDGKDLIAVYLLQAKCGTEIKITAEGVDEDEAVAAIVDLVENRNFDGE